ncbi:hypothetical protein D1P53_002613 [Cryptococcus gattii VGV]|nr:hypothetical protein D1P53_002613 [Cryptococcus gattii VGV]
MADAEFTNGNRVVAMYRRLAELSGEHPEAANFNPKAARLRAKVAYLSEGFHRSASPPREDYLFNGAVLHNLLVTIGDTEEWEAEHYHDMFVDDGQWSLWDGDLARKRRLIQVCEGIPWITTPHIRSKWLVRL